MNKVKKKRKIRFGYTRKRYDRTKFLSLLKTQLYVTEYPFVVLAFDLAMHGHLNQWRKDMAAYFEHCKSVALIIMLECRVFLKNPIIVGLFHDIKEDAHILSWWSIQRIFGKDIFRGLRIVTKEDDKDYYLGIENVQKRDWWIILVKLADRLHNMRNILHMSKKFMRRQLKETERLYPHLINVFEIKVPSRFKYLPDFFRDELEYACNKVRKKLNMRPSKAFKRVS